MADPISTAFVEIRPSFTGFDAELRAGISKAIRKPIPVPVTPQLTGFTAALRKQVTSAVARPINVPVKVVPVVVGGVRNTLNQQIKSKLSGVRPIQIPVTPVVAGAGRAQAGLIATSGAQQQLAQSTNSATSAIKRQGQVVTETGTNLNRFSRGVAATGLAMFGLRGATLAATSAFLAGAAAITALGKGVAFATSFNSQLSVFQATTGATAAQMRQVSDAAKALGRDLTLPGVTAIDAAVAMTELAKAGLTVNDAIAGTRGVLQLAKAANIDFADAVQLAASALNAFELQGERAGVVADTLTNAANAAQGSILDVGIAFQQAAAVGHQVGLSFQDTTLFITQLARAGLTGSDAGTSLRTALIRLINPTKKAQEIFKQLGVEVRDASGNLRPDFFVNLGAALENLSKKQRDATLAIIGGQDAVRALAILSRPTIEDLIRLRNELSKQGTASDVAGARLSGLAKSGANLSNTVEGIALSLGQKATPSLISFTDAITGTVSAVAGSPLVTGTLGDAVAAVADGFRALGTAVRTVVPVLGGLSTGLNSVVQALNVKTVIAFAGAFLLVRKSIISPGIIGAIGTAFIALAGSLRNVVGFLLTLPAALSTAGGATQALARSTAGVSAAFAALGGSATAIAIGVGALAAGFAFLISQESAVEKATRRLTKAIKDLDSASASAAQTAEQLSRSQDIVSTDRLAVTTAKLAEQEARRALLGSGAAEGTFARIQLEHGLQIALNNVHLAEKTLAEDLKDQKTLQEEAAQADLNRRAALAEEARQINALLKAETAQQILRHARTDRAGDEVAVAEAVARTVAKLRERAAEEQKLNTVESRDNAKRLRALAAVATRIEDITNLPTLIRLALDAKDVDTGLRQVAANLRATGDSAGASFVEALRLSMSSRLIPTLLAPINDLMKTLVEIFAGGGVQAGAAFATAVHASVSHALDLARVAINNQVTGLSNQVDTLIGKVQDVQLRGGTLDEQLRIANEARKRADRERSRAEEGLRRAQEKPGRKGEATAQEAVKKARQDQAAAQAEVDRIQGEIDSKRKAAETAHQKAIDDIAEKRKKADQKEIDTLGRGETAFQIRTAIAQRSTGLKDDIRVEEDYQKFLLAWIDRVAVTIKDEQLRQETTQRLKLELAQSRNRQKELEAERKQAIKDATIARRDRKQEALELDVDIAQTQGNVAKEKRAHQALLRFLIERRKHTSRGSVEYKRLTLEIEQQRAAIRDLEKAGKKRSNELAKLEFEFLQTQAGFVGNLLTNLLPTGAVAGTVGGGAIQTPTVGAAPGATIPPADFARAAHQRPIDTGLAKSQAEGGPAGPTSGQLSTLIAISRRQLAILSRLAGGSAHPEAASRRGAEALNDFFGW